MHLALLSRCEELTLSLMSLMYSKNERIGLALPFRGDCMWNKTVLSSVFCCPVMQHQWYEKMHWLYASQRKHMLAFTLHG